MVIDFVVNGKEKQILNLDGSDIGLPMAKAFGEMLMDPRVEKTYSPVRLYTIAKKAVMEKKVELTSEDIEMCKKIIEKSQMFGPLIVAQLILMLEQVTVN